MIHHAKETKTKTVLIDDDHTSLREEVRRHRQWMINLEDAIWRLQRRPSQQSTDKEKREDASPLVEEVQRLRRAVGALEDTVWQLRASVLSTVNNGQQANVPLQPFVRTQPVIANVPTTHPEEPTPSPVEEEAEEAVNTNNDGMVARSTTAF